MINSKRVLALVTARTGSKGLPGKNLRPMCGKPLIGWTIEQGLASRYIDKLVVSTDAEEIAEVARACGASVPFLRPSELASDEASSMDVILHTLDFLERNGEYYDMLVLLEPTSPLRETEDVDSAIELCAGQLGLASVVSVAKAEVSHPSFLFQLRKGFLAPISGTQPNGLRRQDLVEDYYYLEGSVYVSPVSMLRREKSFYHRATVPWIVSRYKAIEIDELADFIMAEALMAARMDRRLV